MSQPKWMGKRRTYPSVLWYMTRTYYKLLHCHLVKLEEHIRASNLSADSSLMRSLIHCPRLGFTVRGIPVSNLFNYYPSCGHWAVPALEPSNSNSIRIRILRI
jgi:hypothetical protein